MRPHRIEIALSDREPARLATYEDVLGLLSRKTRDGSVSAAIALERVLRGAPRASDEDWGDELGRFLADD